MAAQLYDLMTMMEVNRRTRVSPHFWLGFYPRQINFDSEWIYFDKVRSDDRKLAPFVVPNVSGRPQTLEGFTAERFKPAYSKQKDIVDANMPLERVAGEAWGGTLTPLQRYNAVKAELIRRQKVKVMNRWNWMAARSLIDGKVTIKGEDYPETLVDFRRDPDLTNVLTGAAKWDQATAKPLDDLKFMRIAANEIAGVSISRIIMGSNAWELFTQRVDLKDMMDKNYGGVQINGVTRINSLTDGYGDTVEYMGSMSGVAGQSRYEFWVDNTTYIDENGVQQFHLDRNGVVGVSSVFNGARCFGAIKDLAADLRAIPMFFKNWIEQDPSVEYLLTQSAPLMAPGEPDATFYMKVAG
jgi:hypothetical protein